MSTNELLTRGVSSLTPQKLAEKKIESGKPLRLYLGIDPTGNRLHLGHSVPLRKLRAFQDAGHHVIFLIGSFTAMIGDPTGKDTMRNQLTKESVQQNFETYKEQASKILDFDSLEVVYNHEWLEKLSFDDIIQLSSKFTVQQMLERDMFDKRLQDNKPIYMHEFFYPLMQGYDSVMLDVDFEVGGNDQLFNMLAGRTLQSAYEKREKFVMTTTLIEGTDGQKMSKTYNNCIYLEDEPNDMYGKILSMHDDLITTYMECCTDIPLEEIESVTKSIKQGDNPKDHKMRLAREIVTIYYNEQAALEAEESFTKVFGNKEIPTDIVEVTASKEALLLDVLLEHSMIVSKSDGRRVLLQGGIKKDDTPVESVDALAKSGVYKIGKRKFIKIL